MLSYYLLRVSDEIRNNSDPCGSRASASARATTVGVLAARIQKWVNSRKFRPLTAKGGFDMITSDYEERVRADEL